MVRLSRQEMRIAMWLDAPLTHTQIAGRLGMGMNTYKSYFKRLTRKLGAHGRFEAIQRWDELGNNAQRDREGRLRGCRPYAGDPYRAIVADMTDAVREDQRQPMTFADAETEVVGGVRFLTEGAARELARQIAVADAPLLARLARE